MNELRKSRAIILTLAAHASAQTDQRIRADQYWIELHRINSALYIKNNGICYNCLDITYNDHFRDLKCDMCDQSPNPVVMMACDTCFNDIHSHVCSQCMDYRIMRSHNHVVEDDDLCTYCDGPIVAVPVHDDE